jgi:hypothetical protein
MKSEHGRAHTLSYIIEMTKELALMADKCGCHPLAYILRMGAAQGRKELKAAGILLENSYNHQQHHQH